MGARGVQREVKSTCDGKSRDVWAEIVNRRIEDFLQSLCKPEWSLFKSVQHNRLIQVFFEHFFPVILGKHFTNSNIRVRKLC